MARTTRLLPDLADQQVYSRFFDNPAQQAMFMVADIASHRVAAMVWCERIALPQKG